MRPSKLREWAFVKIGMLKDRRLFRVATSGIAHVYAGLPKSRWAVAMDSLSSRSVIYSFGVGNDVEFEAWLTRAVGATVHLFDPTPGVKEWFTGRQRDSRLVFHETGVADSDGLRRMYKPECSGWVSHTIVGHRLSSEEFVERKFRRVSSLMRELGHERIDLLKLDIEGAEYEVIADILSANLKITQLLVEFHHRIMRRGLARTDVTIRSLSEVGMILFAADRRSCNFSFLDETCRVAPRAFRKADR